MPTIEDVTANLANDSLRALRARVMADLATEQDFATAVNRGLRVVRNWRREPDPIPHRFIGRTPYIVVTPALAWLEKRFAKPKEPRPVGRPRKGV